jgi:hypothetical protein
MIMAARTWLCLPMLALEALEPSARAGNVLAQKVLDVKFNADRLFFAPVGRSVAKPDHGFDAVRYMNSRVHGEIYIQVLVLPAEQELLR